MKFLVCGGRNYKDKFHIFTSLSQVKFKVEDEGEQVNYLIQGDCKGADTIAADWAMSNGIQVISMPANFRFYGSKGGPVRNMHMAGLLSPEDIVIAFPGGVGTKNMVKTALEFHKDIKLYVSDGTRLWSNNKLVNRVMDEWPEV